MSTLAQQNYLWVKDLLLNDYFKFLFSVAKSKATLELPLRIAPINHGAYQPSSLLTIKPIDCQAYRPLSLDHQAHWQSSLSTLALLSRLLSLLACFILFKNFVLFYPVFVGWKVIFRMKLKKIFFPPKCVSTL